MGPAGKRKNKLNDQPVYNNKHCECKAILQQQSESLKIGPNQKK